MFETVDIAGQRFRADQVGINDLKDGFFDEAVNERLTFVYFRKGEWTGVRESVKHAEKREAENPQITFTPKAMYEPPATMLADLSEKTGASANEILSMFFMTYLDNHLTVRVITGPKDPEDVAEWEDVCGKGGVAFIPQSQAGPFRYLVNDKRYAILCRLGPNDLRGIIGNDSATIELLRTKYDYEFIAAQVGRAEMEQLRAEPTAHGQPAVQVRIGDIGVGNKVDIRGPMTGSILQGDTVNAHDITVYNRTVLESSMNKELKSVLQQAREAIEKLDLSTRDRADVLDDLGKLTEELTSQQPEPTRVQRFWKRIKEIAPTVASLMDAAASFAEILGSAAVQSA